MSNQDHRSPIDRIAARNKAHGQHFFDTATLGFFNSVVFDDVIHNTLFITSERQPNTRQTYYTIRRAIKGGERIETVGVFQQFSTFNDAMTAATLLNSCAECSIDLWYGEAVFCNAEAATFTYPGTDGEPYCAEHAATQPEMYRSAT